MSVRVEVTVGDPPTAEELALRAAQKEREAEAAARAKAPKDAAVVPEEPERPLTVVAERPEPDAIPADAHLTAS